MMLNTRSSTASGFNKIKQMKKLFWVFTLVMSFGMIACNQDTKTDEQLDSLNQAKADSLLQDALKDSLAQDNVATDSIATADSIAK
jgi:hypothetical protein